MNNLSYFLQAFSSLCLHSNHNTVYKQALSNGFIILIVLLCIGLPGNASAQEELTGKQIDELMKKAESYRTSDEDKERIYTKVISFIEIEMDQGMALFSDYVNALWGRGEVYTKQGKLEHAERDYNQVLNLGRLSRCSRVEGLMYRASMYSRFDLTEKYISDLHEALSVCKKTRLTPDPDIYYEGCGRTCFGVIQNIVSLYVKQNSPQKALEVVDDLLPKLEGGAFIVPMYLLEAEVLIAMENYEKAIAALTMAIDNRYAGDFGNGMLLQKLYITRTALYKELGMYDEAINDVTHLMEEHAYNNPTLISFYVDRAHCFALKNEHGKALEDFESAINVDGSDNKNYALYSRASYYMEREMFNEAIADLSRVIESNPEGVEVLESYYARGRAHKSMENYQKAIDDFEACNRIAVSAGEEINTPDFFINLAEAYEELQDYKKALDNYNKALKYDADNIKAQKGKERCVEKID